MELYIDKEFQSYLFPLQPDEKQALEESIVTYGCRDPLIVWSGVLLDGHNRYVICQKHDVPFQTVEMRFEDREEAKLWIAKNQMARRNLTDYQRSQLALKLKSIIEAKAKERQLSTLRQNIPVVQNSAQRQGTRNDLKEIPQKSAGSSTPNIVQKSAPSQEGKTRDELAKIAGVSHDTISKVEKIENFAPEPVKQAARDNVVSINRAYQITKAVENLPDDQKDTEAKQLLEETRKARDRQIDLDHKVVMEFEDAVSKAACLKITDERFQIWLNAFHEDDFDMSLRFIYDSMKKLSELKDRLLDSQKPKSTKEVK